MGNFFTAVQDRIQSNIFFYSLQVRQLWNLQNENWLVFVNQGPMTANYLETIFFWDMVVNNRPVCAPKDLSHCEVCHLRPNWHHILMLYNTLFILWGILVENGILLTKLFWSTVRKKCSSDREKPLKFEAEGQEFAFANILRWLEQFWKQKI